MTSSNEAKPGSIVMGKATTSSFLSRTVMRRLWTSRHPWPDLTEAKPDLIEEVLWPIDSLRCEQTWRELSDKADLIYGVFPAQALETIGESRKPVFSAVSEPIYEPDTKRVREFKFIRWARLR